MMKIAIGGMPRSGKTTLARKLSIEFGITVRHTDDLVSSHAWSAASEAIADWFNAPGSFIIEGVTVSRALRKWRAQHPHEAPPVNRCIFLNQPHVPLTSAQSAMAMGVELIHSELADWLRTHGVRG